MLGRQQIAGLPTAISELFKNAHDAYANRVEVDFYRYDDLFVLRDDGVGMSREDFELRWLTLGTESKLGAGAGLALPPTDSTQESRSILGEKGIGRLAIAALGNQVLVMTRPRESKKERRLTAAFLNWKVFEIPGLDLDVIDIPLLDFGEIAFPMASDVQKLIDEFQKNLRKIAPPNQSSTIDEILKEVSEFKVDPTEIAGFLPAGPSLLNGGAGTHFYIKPAEESLKYDIGEPDDDQRASPLIKALIGFTNTMTPGAKEPAIIASFRDHEVNGVCVERIGESAFFTPEEFKAADHHFRGRFDSHGQFRGKVTVYDHEPVDYVCSWSNPTGENTRCGPFSLNLAYMQGVARESRLPAEEHSRMAAKLNRMGGLYLYRDGVRILPYGDSDYDFLDIERRRTKGAGHYFFSYRRMFGVIEITREKNGNLVEKAGREGFRQNKAYREFREILENFFVQLAADFFREGGTHTDMFSERKEELDRNKRLRRQRETESRTRRAEFAKRLDDAFRQIEDGVPESQTKEVLAWVNQQLRQLATNREVLTSQTFQVGEEARRRLAEVKESLRVVKPRGWGLNKTLRRDWDAYQREYLRLDANVFEIAVERIDASINEVAAQAGVDVDHKTLIRMSLNSTKDKSDHRIKTLETEIRSVNSQLDTRIHDKARQSVAAVRSVVEEVLADFEAVEVGRLKQEELDRLRGQWDRRISEVVERESAELESLRDQLREVGTGSGLLAKDVNEALEEELQELRERDLAQLELVQIGMALGVIHHEFRGCVKSLRRSLQSLQRWASTNKSLKTLYTDIRANFDHLDGYLTLFTPLTRRLHRTAVQITGSAIYHFLMDLFQDRLERHRTQLIATDAFKHHTISGYPSSFYPCFVNLVDNSIYWLSDWKGKRVITLDSIDDALIVEDTGPGIKPRDVAAVFDLGFTRKPGGHGLGLHISRETLAKVGYDLVLDPHEKGEGARFRITPKTA